MSKKPTLQRYNTQARSIKEIKFNWELWNDDVNTFTRKSIQKAFLLKNIASNTPGKKKVAWFYVISLPGQQDFETEYRAAKSHESQLNNFIWNAWLSTKKKKALLILMKDTALSPKFATTRRIGGQDISVFFLIIGQVEGRYYSTFKLSTREAKTNKLLLEEMDAWVRD